LKCFTLPKPQKINIFFPKKT